jgi:hypothetical protein
MYKKNTGGLQSAYRGGPDGVWSRESVIHVRTTGHHIRRDSIYLPFFYVVRILACDLKVAQVNTIVRLVNSRCREEERREGSGYKHGV